MNGPLALIKEDPEGGYDVVDTRGKEPLAWRSNIGDASAIASMLNARYPSGSPAPAWDSLVHEIRMDRIGEGPEPSLGAMVSTGALHGMIPDAIGGPLDPGLWRPCPRYSDEEAV